MEAFAGAAVVLALGFVWFVMGPLSGILKTRSDAKVSISNNMLEIERQKTEQKRLENETARLNTAATATQ